MGNSRIGWPYYCHCVNAHFIALVHLPSQLACCHLEYISVSTVCLFIHMSTGSIKFTHLNYTIQYVFGIFIDVSNHHHNVFKNIFITPKRSPVSFSSHFPPPALGNCSSTFCLCKITCSGQTYHLKEINM